MLLRFARLMIVALALVPGLVLAMSHEETAVEATTTETTPVEAPAAEAPAPEIEEAKPAAKVVVFLPEQVDTEWFWYYYSDVAQHVVQSAIEKALINAGFDVIDLGSLKKLEAAGSLESITSNDGATEQARAAGADYAIVGKATAVKSSQSEAFGQTVIRSNAEITARIIRVSDGKVVAVEDASAMKGGQAARAAGQEALKAAAGPIGRKLATALTKVASP